MSQTITLETRSRPVIIPNHRLAIQYNVPSYHTTTRDQFDKRAPRGFYLGVDELLISLVDLRTYFSTGMNFGPGRNLGTRECFSNGVLLDVVPSITSIFDYNRHIGNLLGKVDYTHMYGSGHNAIIYARCILHTTRILYPYFVKINSVGVVSLISGDDYYSATEYGHNCLLIFSYGYTDDNHGINIMRAGGEYRNFTYTMSKRVNNVLLIFERDNSLKINDHYIDAEFMFV